jgi:hypothetical protein
LRIYQLFTVITVQHAEHAKLQLQFILIVILVEQFEQQLQLQQFELQQPQFQQHCIVDAVLFFVIAIVIKFQQHAWISFEQLLAVGVIAKQFVTIQFFTAVRLAVEFTTVEFTTVKFTTVKFTAIWLATVWLATVRFAAVRLPAIQSQYRQPERLAVWQSGQHCGFSTRRVWPCWQLYTR